MRPREISPWWMQGFMLVAVAGCSGGSAGGTDADEEGANDSSGISDAELFDAGSADTEDAEPPPVAPPHCGDGVLHPDEECDDGNRLDGDDCDWLCRRGPGEPVDDTPDPSVGELERDVSWTPVTPMPGSEESPLSWLPAQLVWTGSAYATTWVSHAGDGPSWGKAHFRTFDRTGRALVPDWTYEYPDRAFSSVDLGWSGRVFALAWCTPASCVDPALHALILDEVGKPVIGPLTLLEDFRGSVVAATWDGQAFAVVLTTEEEPHPVWLVRFGEDGLLRSPPSEIYEPAADIALPGVVAASSPGATVSAFFQKRETDAEARLGWFAVARDGAALHPFTEIGPGACESVAMAWGGSRFGIAFDTRSGRTPGFHLALLDGAGRLVGPPRFLADRDWHGTTALAWGAGGWTLAYNGEPLQVRLLRTDASGAVIREIETGGPEAAGSYDLAIAFDGEGFGIVSGMHGSSLQFTRYVVVP